MSFYGIPPGQWPTKDCATETCTNKVGGNEKLCPVCLRLEAAEALALNNLVREERELMFAWLERTLAFEAWADEHEPNESSQ